MTQLHFPWLEMAILVPLAGAAWVGRLRDPDGARRDSLAVGLWALVATLGAWVDFGTLHTFEAHDRWDSVSGLLGPDVLVVDELSAPLLPLAALLHFLTVLGTLRTKARRYRFDLALVALSILLGLLSCREPWAIIVLLLLGAVLPGWELRARGQSVRVYVCHMAAFAALLIVGQWLMDSSRSGQSGHLVGSMLLAAAVLLRSGIVPVHCWMTDLFEKASFGTALLFVTPMAGAYAAVRLVLPHASDWALQSMGLVSMVTAVYAGGMALVQREARRFFCFLFLSHSSLVLVGLEMATPIALTGALCVWLSVGLSLTGFGLTLRAIEARAGRLDLTWCHGLYEHTPFLAAFFLLTGLASIGFPGTAGFVGTELLLEGAVEVYPWVGLAVVIAAAFNGIAVLQVYFRLFSGKRHVSSIALHSRPAERVAVLCLTVLMLGGGLFPQPGVQSRYHAAREIMTRRAPAWKAPHALETTRDTSGLPRGLHRVHGQSAEPKSTPPNHH